MSSPSTATHPASRPEWDQAWQASQLRQRVVRGLGGIPALLAAVLPVDGGVLAAPVHWHCALYGDLVLRKVGTSFMPPDCYRVLRDHGLDWDDTTVADALVGFLTHLKDAGHLDYDCDAAGRPASAIRVTADLTTRPAPKVPGFVGMLNSGRSDLSERAKDIARGSADIAPAPAVQGSPAGTVRKPRNSNEAAWLQETTGTLASVGLSEQTIEALLGIARWGTPLVVENGKG